MANRDPKQCKQAVDGFWNNERDLVREGQGSRDWTPEQQTDIMNYKSDGTERKNAVAPKDETGKSYEGHHMKSVEAHPDYQGRSDNIQPLTRDEHISAHGGDTKNPTNGYYNPETGETTDFGQNEPSKPEPIKLSQPINQSNQQSAPPENEAASASHDSSPGQENDNDYDYGYGIG